MSSIEVDYLIKPTVVNGKLNAIYYPSVSIRLSISHKMYPHNIDCLVDSGADFNLFPADIGDLLGLSVKKGRKQEHMGIGSVGIIAYSHPIKIFLDGYSFETEAHFSYDHKIPLLGRMGFFKYFKLVTFDESRKLLKLDY